jgi:hypothetical protein
VIKKIDIMEFPYENVEINFSGNEQAKHEWASKKNAIS